MQPTLKKGDTVIVLSGKDKGKKGKVLRIFPEDNKAIVENIMVIKRHVKPSRTFQGGIIEKPSKVNTSKLMLVCPHCGKPAKLGKKDGVRICKKCGQTADKGK